MRKAHLARHARQAALALQAAEEAQQKEQQTAMAAWMPGPASRGARGNSGVAGSHDDDLALEQAVSELISLRREVCGQPVTGDASDWRKAYCIPFGF